MTTLPITLTENLLSAWDAAASGAVDDSLNCELPVCNIVLTNDTIRIAICRNGLVVDTAAFALGVHTFRISDIGVMESISESGETFLNGLAKDISQGDKLQSDMPELLGNLIGETVVNLGLRRLTPQITMRMLCTEPLGRPFGRMKYVLCNIADESRMTTPTFQGMQESLLERELEYAVRSCPDDRTLADSVQTIRLETTGTEALPTIQWAPVILLDNHEDWQWLERARRHLLTAATPYAVLSNGRFSVYADENKFRTSIFAPPEPFLANWFLSIHETGGPEVRPYESKTIELHVVQVRGVKNGVTSV